MAAKGEDDGASLPSAVRAMLIKARAALKKKGDDGSQGGARQTVSVSMGWPEIRGIYKMYTSVQSARLARDKAKKTAAKAVRELEEARAAFERDLGNIDLLNDKAVISLLIDVRNILTGESDSPQALYGTKKRIEELIARARKRDRRRGRR